MILITLIPTLELRASIPYGIFGTDMHWASVFAVCVITNIILGPLVYLVLDRFIHVFLKIGMFNRQYNKYLEKTQKKIQPQVEKYGILGLAIFIGIPLPGTGSYTAAIAAHVLGMKMKRFFIANAIGVIIAGTLVTLIVSSGGWLFNLFF